MSFNGSIDLQNKTSIAIHQPNHKKKSYSVIPNQVRERLINRILSKKVTIKQVWHKKIKHIHSKFLNSKIFNPGC